METLESRGIRSIRADMTAKPRFSTGLIVAAMREESVNADTYPARKVIKEFTERRGTAVTVTS
jgi:hypothetical protein